MGWLAELRLKLVWLAELKMLLLRYDTAAAAAAADADASGTAFHFLERRMKTFALLPWFSPVLCALCSSMAAAHGMFCCKNYNHARPLVTP